MHRCEETVKEIDLTKMEVITVRSSPSSAFMVNLPPPAAHPGLLFAGNQPPFAAITSPPPFAAHISPPATTSPPTDAHVTLGLLVAYEGMCWSLAPEPAPRQHPLVLAPRQCPPVPAPRQRPPVPAPRKCSPVPLLVPPSSPERPESQRFPRVSAPRASPRVSASRALKVRS